MSQNSTIFINKIAKSSLIVFIGTVITLFLGFLCRLVLIRLTSQDEYGLYTLVLTIISIFTMLSTLGLQEGLTRHIASLKGKENIKLIPEIIVSSVVIGLIASFISILIIHATADYIALNVFNSAEMSTLLKFVSISIPFSVLINIFVAIFRAFNITKVKVVFQDILKSFSHLSFLGLIALLNLSFIAMIYSYVFSIIITCFFLLLYFFKKSPIRVKWNQIIVNNKTKELFVYSMPLLAVGILLTLMSWTDTLMLGYFKTTEMVASYNAAYPIAQLLSLVINSIGFLYVPIVSQLYSSNRIDELGSINASSTKWCFILTFPLFVLIFLFPDQILYLLYGSCYTDSSEALKVLSFGFIMNSYFGLNYYTLLSTGKSSLIMFCSLASTIINILLNLLLIPSYGMLGAAIASAFSFTIIEIYMTYKLYNFLHFHPFTRNYLSFSFKSILLLLFCYGLKDMFALTFSSFTIFVLLFISLYIFLIYKALDANDLLILSKIRTSLFTRLLH